MKIDIFVLIPDYDIVVCDRSTPDELVRSEKSEDTEESNGQNARFKTEICRNFKERGHCLYGDLCQFAHGKDVRFTDSKLKLSLIH